MNSTLLLKNGKFSQYSGFTLIELVIVIIMIGILAVTIVPKFSTSNGYEEIGYQTEVISKLRAIQLKSMQDTTTISPPVTVSRCKLVYVTEKKLGIPDDNCETPSFSSSTELSNTIVKISEQSLTFDDHSGGYSFSFDQMGRPDQARTISILGGEKTLTININAEGYISAN